MRNADPEFLSIVPFKVYIIRDNYWIHKAIYNREMPEDIVRGLIYQLYATTAINCHMDYNFHIFFNIIVVNQLV